MGKETEHLQKYIKTTIIGIQEIATIDMFSVGLIFYTPVKIMMHIWR